MLLSFLCNQTLFIFSAQCFDVIAATRTPHLHTSSTLLTSLGEVCAFILLTDLLAIHCSQRFEAQLAM